MPSRLGSFGKILRAAASSELSIWADENVKCPKMVLGSFGMARSSLEMGWDDAVVPERYEDREALRVDAPLAWSLSSGDTLSPFAV